MIYVTLLAVLALIGCTLGVLRALRDGSDRVARAMQTGFTEETEARLFQLEQLVDALPLKWEEMVKQAKRSEDRARAVVKRAEAELAEAGFEHPGLDAEASELRRLYGDGGEGEGLRPVHQNVEPHPAPRAESDGYEDWERELLNRKYAS